ncbi:HAD family hydrolase [Streptomyces sp. NPDC090131]|uniref:HAD family hydrolase n=1 Tax=Streptomyces sp. NPDC090131 TaxID=3365954 RepID=UPI00381E5FEF
MTGRRVAFFDVDETLLNTKTMLAFWSYWRHHHAAHGPAVTPGGLTPAQLLTLPREEANRRFWQLFRGVRTEDLMEVGRRWYEEYRRGDGAVIVSALAELRRHQRRGDMVVLVSGSMRACLEPFAAELGADLLLCTEQEQSASGVLTGEVTQSMIGPAKARAVRSVMAGLGAQQRDCFAYGDHASDLPMLQSVGRPVLVGRDPVLRAAAARAGQWRVLPSVAGSFEALREDVAA